MLILYVLHNFCSVTAAIERGARSRKGRSFERGRSFNQILYRLRTDKSFFIIQKRGRARALEQRKNENGNSSL